MGKKRGVKAGTGGDPNPTVADGGAGGATWTTHAGMDGGAGPSWSSSWAVGGGGGNGPPTFRVADYEYGVRNRHHAETDPPHRAGMTRKEAEHWIKLFDLEEATGIPNPWRLIARPRGDWSDVTP